MELAKTLKKLLAEKDITASKLSRDLKIPTSSINDWLAGRTPRDLDAVREVANYLKVSTHHLLFGEPEPQSIISEILEKTEIHTGLYEISVKRVKPKGEK